MGLYDTVIFQCPKCFMSIEMQSKAGDCHLRDYDCNSVPGEIAQSLVNEYAHCPLCNESFKVVENNEVPKTVKLKLE